MTLGVVLSGPPGCPPPGGQCLAFAQLPGGLFSSGFGSENAPSPPGWAYCGKCPCLPRSQDRLSAASSTAPVPAKPGVKFGLDSFSINFRCSLPLEALRNPGAFMASRFLLPQVMKMKFCSNCSEYEHSYQKSGFNSTLSLISSVLCFMLPTTLSRSAQLTKARYGQLWAATSTIPLQFADAAAALSMKKEVRISNWASLVACATSCRTTQTCRCRTQDPHGPA